MLLYSNTFTVKYLPTNYIKITRTCNYRLGNQVELNANYAENIGNSRLIVRKAQE